MDNSNAGSAASEPEVQLYAKRWWLMGCIGLQSMLFPLSTNYFGISNNVFAEYFDITFPKVDWFSLISLISTCFVSSFMTYFSLMNADYFRRFSIMAAACSVAGSLCDFVAFNWPSLYAFIYIGGLFFGVLNGYLLIAPISFAVLWFSDNEIGSAISVRLVATRLGFILAILIPAQLISPCSRHNIASVNQVSNTSVSVKCNETWLEMQKRNLLAYQGSLTIYSTIALIVLLLLASDKPPKPPTKAQALLRRQYPSVEQLTYHEQAKLYVQEIKVLFKEPTVINVIANLSILYSSNWLQFLFISKTYRSVFTNFLQSNPNLISSYLIVLYETGAIIGTVISGQIMDRLKKHIFLVRVGYLLTVVCVIILIFGFFFQKCSFNFHKQHSSGH